MPDYFVQTPASDLVAVTTDRSSAISAARRDGFQHSRNTAVYERREGRPMRRVWSYGREGRGRRPG